MSLFNIFFKFNSFSYNLKPLKFIYINNYLKNIYFFYRMFLIFDLIFEEGLLIDFLQKKWADNWIRGFLIYSANLFSESDLYYKITRFYLTNIIWPMHKLSFFIVDSVSNTLFFTFFFFLLFFFIIIFYYYFLLLF